MDYRLDELSRIQKIAGAFGLIILVAGTGLVAEKYFLPEKSVQVDEGLPGEAESGQEDTESAGQKDQSSMEILKSGTFEGKTGHTVKGKVKIVEIDGENYLRFEDYEQTQGPDVFVYLTPSKDPDSGSEISEGEKIRIDGGPDGGEITKEGNFNQKIPAEVDVTEYNGLAIWCDAFSTPFGAAELG